jgi:hypothetical protein
MVQLSGLPPWGTVTSISPSTFDPAIAYVSVDFHLMDNRDPFIYKTSDLGKTWKLITGDLPKHPLAYVRTITEDPNCAGLLFAGTGNGLHYSLDDGAHWTSIDSGLPHAPVTWAVVQRNFRDLVISTYGRGLYILDDISPLEQMARAKSDAAVILFEPRPAYRFTRAPLSLLSFTLKAAPKDPVVVEILDADGKVVRKLESKARAGLNRVKWDLRYDSPRLVALRTAAPDNPHIWTEPRFRDADSRQITHWGLKPAESGPIAAPGKYTVRLTVDGQSYTQPLTILRDPRSPGSESDIDLSVRTQLRICEDINRVSDTINHIEWIRKQVEVIQVMLRPPKKKEPEKPTAEPESEYDFPEPALAPAKPLREEETKRRAELLKSAGELDKKLFAIEYKLVSPALTDSDDKYFVQQDQLYVNLLWLNAEVGAGGGNVAGGADFPPTDTQRGLLESYEIGLNAAEAEYQKFLKDELPPFNRGLTDSNIVAVVAKAIH